MSEFASFNVDPTLNALENCRQNVRSNADVFVLIIGGRYGSIAAEYGKSVVNLEYEAAVQSSLDIFVFVDNSVLTLLPIWKANHDVVLAPSVESNKVLEFVDRIRSEQRWTFPFAKADDISEVLAVQLSGQLRDLLVKRRSGHLDYLRAFQDETPAALSLVRSRAPFWEFLLTAELHSARLTASSERYKDIQAGRVLGPHKVLGGHEYMRWVGTKFPEMIAAVNHLTHVFVEEVKASWGPPGTSGDPAKILSTANAFGAVLESLVDLESDVYRTVGPKATAPLRQVLRGITEEVFQAVGPMPQMLREAVEKAKLHNVEDGPLVININLTFKFTKADRFVEACSAVQAKMTPGEW